MPDADGNATAEETAATAAADPGAAAAAAVKAPADLQVELDQVKARAFELEIGALHTANPDLPDAAFTGDDLAAVQTAVATARATADHVRQQLEAARNGTADPAAAAAATIAAATGAGVTRTPATAPEGTRGYDRILFGLQNQGAK